MVHAMHWDGIIQMAVALVLLFLGHSFQRWFLRVPTITLSLLSFLLALNLLDVANLRGFAPWFVLRIVEDMMIGAIAVGVIWLRTHRPRTTL